MQVGLHYAGGLEGTYEKSLRLFYKNIFNSCENLKGFLQESMLHDFSVEVHGLKAALASIGHSALADLAKQLELASKEYNVTFCQDTLPQFLASSIALANRLERIFAQSADDVALAQGDNAMLQQFIADIFDAVDNFDRELAVSLVSQMAEYHFSDENDAIIRNIGHALDDFDFELSLSLIENLTFST